MPADWVVQDGTGLIARMLVSHQAAALVRGWPGPCVQAAHFLTIHCPTSCRPPALFAILYTSKTQVTPTPRPAQTTPKHATHGLLVGHPQGCTTCSRGGASPSTPSWARRGRAACPTARPSAWSRSATTPLCPPSIWRGQVRRGARSFLFSIIRCSCYLPLIS